MQNGAAGISVIHEDRYPGLGEEFLDCADACIQVVLRMPELYAKGTLGLPKRIGATISLCGY